MLSTLPKFCESWVNASDWFSGLLEVQQPGYFRLDLRVYRKRGFAARRNSTFAMDFQNVTMQKNTAYRYYDPFTRKVETKFQLGLIPNLGVLKAAKTRYFCCPTA